MALVLASNDDNASKYNWKDITGVHYHYPNGYKNLIRPGEPFVYYRGMRRANAARGQAEYFGRGVVGVIWRDPEVPTDASKGRWAWYCAVEGFEPFVEPVPAKIDGRHLEPMQHPNAWRNGVRRISDEVYREILELAGHLSGSTTPLTRNVLPRLDVVSVTQVPAGTLLANSPIVTSRVLDEAGAGTGPRYSRSAKLIGDRAEQIVLRWLRDTQPGATGIRWVAREGVTPGWDIEFTDAEGRFIAVEVKGTGGSLLSNFEITANEIAAMRSRGSSYWLVLVGGCLGTSCQIELMVNPASLLDRELTLTPVRWRISKADGIERGLAEVHEAGTQPSEEEAVTP